MEAAQAAGKVIGGIAGYEAGKFNRATSQTMATEDERAGAAEEARIREAARMAIGDQVAAQGANGFQQGTGSAIDALAQSQINAAFDALIARQDAARRARARRIQGDIAYAEGSNALVQGMLGAASSVQQQNSDWATARRGTTPSGGGVGRSPNSTKSGGTPNTPRGG
jgi:hypothetical protein